MRRILAILAATFLIALVAMGLRKTLFSPSTADAVRNQLLDYSTAQGWRWETHSGFSSRISGGAPHGAATRAVEAVTGSKDETAHNEYGFSDGTGSIVVRVEHDGTLVKRIGITGKGVPTGTEKKLQKYLKAQPGWAPCQIHQE